MKRLGSLAFRYIANEDNKLQLNINAQNCLHCKVRLSLHLHVKSAKYLLYIVQPSTVLVVSVFTCEHEMIKVHYKAVANYVLFVIVQACDIKDPKQNIKWTVPEGGGGPGYTIM